MEFAFGVVVPLGGVTERRGGGDEASEGIVGHG